MYWSSVEYMKEEGGNVEVNGVGWAFAPVYWMPKPAVVFQLMFSGDGPKVLGLLCGLGGGTDAIDGGQRLGDWCIVRLVKLMSGIDARAYWVHGCGSTVLDGKGVM